MKTVIRRLARLEDRFAPAARRNPKHSVRLVVSLMDHPLSLETSTCTRTLNTANGYLTEVVRLDGIRGGITDDELDRFVEKFPVERIQ